MELVPVIDLMGGVVVHAHGGRRTEYRPIVTPLCASSEPRQVVAGLLRLAPFRRLYVADLDAIGGGAPHDAILEGLAAAHPAVEFWVDRGIADAAPARAWLARAPGTLVLGSESLASAAPLAGLADERRIVLSLDFRADAFQGPEAVLQDAALWPARVIVMTLARVGGGAGPDLDRVREIVARAAARAVYAAGGVRDGADVRALAALGAAGVLVASALHAGSITPGEIAGLE
jgi:phosphoribosylformimino-5-aminoimidazole carboxamide ribotide isomerase